MQPATAPCSTARAVCTAGPSVARASAEIDSPRQARSINGASRSRSASVDAAESVNATAALAICPSSTSWSSSWLPAPREAVDPPGFPVSPLPLYGRRRVDGETQPEAWGRRGAVAGCAGAPRCARRSASGPVGAVPVCPSCGGGDMSRVRRPLPADRPARWTAAGSPKGLHPLRWMPCGSSSSRSSFSASHAPSWRVMLSTVALFGRGTPFAFINTCSPANFVARSCAALGRGGRPSSAAITAAESFPVSGSAG